ncbi:MAG: hypothetical protein IT287_01490 [Bdellovibrionaceae bacterium]|nr:hypothetical protein [Pseudobdellovibrionaceae bacterium]
MNKTKHEAIHLSPLETIAISRGSDKKIRIYSTVNNKLQKTLHLDDVLAKYSGDIFEVVSVTESHFVLALESNYHRAKNEEMGLRMFRPQVLLLMDLSGSIIGHYSSEVVIKGSVHLPGKNTWIVADQDMLQLIELPQEHFGYYGTLTHVLHDALVTKHYVSSVGASLDGNTLYVGMSKLRSHSPHSEIYAIDITDVKHPVLRYKKEVIASQIYRIEELSDRSLRVTGSMLDARPHEPAIEWIVP